MAREYIERRDGGFYLIGSRVPLDVIVHEYKNGQPVEGIRQSFPTLSLEQVHGALAFYLANKAEVETSILETERLWEDFRAKHPPPPGLKAEMEHRRAARYLSGIA
jgi:uncharacterized protein (DUF433 family)